MERFLSKIVEKPWGREIIIECNHTYAFKILEVKAGHRLSLQYHEKKIETMYCVSGQGELHYEGQVIPFYSGQHITIHPKELHRLCAGPNSDLVVAEASSTELNDVVRLKDDYDRN